MKGDPIVWLKKCCVISSHTDQLQGGNSVEYGGTFKLAPLFMALKDMELSELLMKLGIPAHAFSLSFSLQNCNYLGKRIFGCLLSKGGFSIVCCKLYQWSPLSFSKSNLVNMSAIFISPEM